MVAVSRHMHPGQLSVEGSVKPSTLRSSQTPTSWLGKKATGSQCIVASLRRLSEICRSTFVGVDAGQRCRGALAEVCFERPPGGSVCADRGKSRARGKSCSETQSYRSQKSIALDSRLQGIAESKDDGCQPQQCTDLQSAVGHVLFGELDNCEFDFSNCSDVASGESCEIKCNLPYVSVDDGSMGYANCPAENVDRFQMMTWTLPKCRLDCPEVSPVPIAYQRVNASWVCAPGYAGTVQAEMQDTLSFVSFPVGFQDRLGFQCAPAPSSTQRMYC
ncbi:Hypothetical protein (Fragment) [Durusdinium trenchii]|uniref:Uncharacterized protein n=1 Tax=Durusdinium trenchii TaxID=1381693 RepID=A0ABP0LU52_9DINO